ncbi:hypothetical protein [uncultured Tateyamaria sp.]|uniref:hypothetical protein n=1 Tax=Tateyamaria sp. 1078 TaxID=3417464 RepID=UPI00260458DD|nr:hypothetical protein [uncultured Tateyamaria sp.]
MSDIDALQGRLAAAMDRIANAASTLESAGADDTAALQTALEDEKLANAQLTERVRKLSEQQESALAEAKAAAQAAEARTAALDLELQRMRQASDQLRSSNEALRRANEDGVGEPHLINKAMLAELEALRAARAADIAEASSIIGALTPLLDPAQPEDDTHA